MDATERAAKMQTVAEAGLGGNGGELEIRFLEKSRGVFQTEFFQDRSWTPAQVPVAGVLQSTSRYAGRPGDIRDGDQLPEMLQAAVENGG